MKTNKKGIELTRETVIIAIIVIIVLIIIVIFYIKEGGNLINYFKDTATQVNASRSKLQW